MSGIAPTASISLHSQLKPLGPVASVSMADVQRQSVMEDPRYLKYVKDQHPDHVVVDEVTTAKDLVARAKDQQPARGYWQREWGVVRSTAAALQQNHFWTLAIPALSGLLGGIVGFDWIQFWANGSAHFDPAFFSPYAALLTVVPILGVLLGARAVDTIGYLLFFSRKFESYTAYRDCAIYEREQINNSNVSDFIAFVRDLFHVVGGVLGPMALMSFSHFNVPHGGITAPAIAAAIAVVTYFGPMVADIAREKHEKLLGEEAVKQGIQTMALAAESDGMVAGYQVTRLEAGLELMAGPVMERIESHESTITANLEVVREALASVDSFYAGLDQSRLTSAQVRQMQEQQQEERAELERLEAGLVSVLEGLQGSKRDAQFVANKIRMQLGQPVVVDLDSDSDTVYQDQVAQTLALRRRALQAASGHVDQSVDEARQIVDAMNRVMQEVGAAESTHRELVALGA